MQLPQRKYFNLSLIQKNEGFVNQYLGDGIMALFPKGPGNALQAAIDMQKMINVYNLRRIDEGFISISVGMGLHTGPLIKTEILREFDKMDVVQLNLFADTKVITPTGKQTTAKQWGKDLDLFYTPSIVLFSPAGNEIMRVDSIVQFYRLWGVLDYVNKRAYDTGIDYQGWRLQQRETIE